MKSCRGQIDKSKCSRSRKGAWIEIGVFPRGLLLQDVAPVRERGLKSGENAKNDTRGAGRSRKGAWIEMSKAGV